MEIRYDVTDWKNRYDENKSVRPASADDAVDLMRESNTRVSDISVALIVGRELGKVQDETLPSNKLANLMGLSLHLARHRSRQMAQVKIAGHDTEVPRYVANATIEEGVDATYEATVPTPNGNGSGKHKPAPSNPPVRVVDFSNPVAADRAIAYLMTNVMGRISERLKLVALHKPEDLDAVVADLKAGIDRMVEKLK